MFYVLLPYRTTTALEVIYTEVIRKTHVFKVLCKNVNRTTNSLTVPCKEVCQNNQCSKGSVQHFDRHPNDLNALYRRTTEQPNALTIVYTEV